MKRPRTSLSNECQLITPETAVFSDYLPDVLQKSPFSPPLIPHETQDTSDNVWKQLSLHGRNGQRKYLNLAERELFLEGSLRLPLKRKAFCMVLLYAGCRISEALALDPVHLDAMEGVLVFETLKQRRKGVYRAVPIPLELIKSYSHSQLTTASLTSQGRRLGVLLASYGIVCDDPVPCIENAAENGIKGANYDQMGVQYIVYWPGMRNEDCDG